MNRSLRATLIAVGVAAVGALAVPASATAAGWPSTIGPGQVFSDIAPSSLALPGEEVRLHLTPFPEVGADHCVSDRLIGSATVAADGRYSITLDGTLPDGRYALELCSDRLLIGYGSGVTMDNPFTLTSPAAEEALTPDASVAGTGSPGSTVEARDQDGTVVGSAVVGTDGTWDIAFTGLPQGPLTVTFAQDDKSFDASFTIVADSESSPLLEPLTASAAAVTLVGLGLLYLRRRRATASAA